MKKIALLTALTLFFTLLCIATAGAEEKVFNLNISYYRTLVGRDGIRHPDAKKIEDIIGFWADGLYEATNGEHYLGRVIITQGGTKFRLNDQDNERNTHVIWGKKGHPCAWPLGITSYGKDHLYMYDDFWNEPKEKNEKSEQQRDFLNDLDGLVYGGYVLMHESGHYIYGLFDEYKLTVSHDRLLGLYTSADIYDALEYPSLMNSIWGILGKGGDIRQLNFSNKAMYGKKTNTKQHAEHRESCWETLEKRYKFSNRPQSPTLFSESKEITPGVEGTKDNSRKYLKIIWNAKAIYQIVLDRSASMSEGNRFKNAIRSAKALVNALKPGDAVGITLFTAVHAETLPIAELPQNTGKCEQMKNEIFSLLDRITIDNGSNSTSGTAIYDTLAHVADKLSSSRKFRSAGGFFDNPKLVFLLTDGEDNRSKNKVYDIVKKYKERNIPIFSVGIGDGISEKTLKNLTDGTGGSYALSSHPIDLDEMMLAPLRSRGLAPVTTRDLSIKPSGSASAGFAVDSGINELTVSMASENIRDNFTATLVSPSGSSIPIAFNKEIGKYLYVQKKPAAGKWMLQAKNKSGSADGVRVSVYGEALEEMNTEGTYIAESVIEESKGGKGFTITANANRRGMRASGLTATAEITHPDGVVQSVPINDDGTMGDAEAEDGVYTAQIANCPEKGNYKAVIRFTNPNKKAYEVVKGLQFHKPFDLKDGETFTVPEKGEMLAEDIERVTTVTFSVDAPFGTHVALSAPEPTPPVIVIDKNEFVEDSGHDYSDDVDFSDYDEKERQKRMEGYKMIHYDYKSNKKPK